MPFKSKAQARKCFAMKGKGQAKGWDCKEWADKTNFKKLPEKKKKATMNKKAMLAAILYKYANGGGEPEEYPENKKEEKNLVPAVAKFLRKNPNPDDEKLHAAAERSGIEVDDVEEAAYRLATSKAKSMKKKSESVIRKVKGMMTPAEKEAGGYVMPVMQYTSKAEQDLNEMSKFRHVGRYAGGKNMKDDCVGVPWKVDKEKAACAGRAYGKKKKMKKPVKKPIPGAKPVVKKAYTVYKPEGSSFSTRQMLKDILHGAVLGAGGGAAATSLADLASDKAPSLSGASAGALYGGGLGGLFGGLGSYLSQRANADRAFKSQLPSGNYIAASNWKDPSTGKSLGGGLVREDELSGNKTDKEGKKDKKEEKSSAYVMGAMLALEKTAAGVSDVAGALGDVFTQKARESASQAPLLERFSPHLLGAGIGGLAGAGIGGLTGLFSKGERDPETGKQNKGYLKRILLGALGGAGLGAAGGAFHKARRFSKADEAVRRTLGDFSQIAQSQSPLPPQVADLPPEMLRDAISMQAKADPRMKQVGDYLYKNLYSYGQPIPASTIDALKRIQEVSGKQPGMFGPAAFPGGFKPGIF